MVVEELRAIVVSLTLNGKWGVGRHSDLFLTTTGDAISRVSSGRPACVLEGSVPARSQRCGGVAGKPEVHSARSFKVLYSLRGLREGSTVQFALDVLGRANVVTAVRIIVKCGANNVYDI